MIDTPTVDWLALSPSLALLRPRACASPGAVLVPAIARRPFSAVLCAGGFIRGRDPRRNRVRPLAERRGADRRDDGARPIRLLRAGPRLRRRRARHARELGDGRRSRVGEYYSLLAVAGAGMLFFVQAGSVLTLFLGLVVLPRSRSTSSARSTRSAASLEAELKYLIVGSFGSSILLFGTALVYGATGGSLGAIREAPGADDPLFVVGLRDDHRGPGVQGLRRAVPHVDAGRLPGRTDSRREVHVGGDEAVALVATVRILVTAFPEQDEIWTAAVAAIAIASLAIGNFAALVQHDVKRLLAYSSISQAGFLLIAVAANTSEATSALLYFPRAVPARRPSARSR